SDHLEEEKPMCEMEDEQEALEKLIDASVRKRYTGELWCSGQDQDGEQYFCPEDALEIGDLLYSVWGDQLSEKAFKAALKRLSEDGAPRYEWHERTCCADEFEISSLGPE